LQNSGFTVCITLIQSHAFIYLVSVGLSPQPVSPLHWFTPPSSYNMVLETTQPQSSSLGYKPELKLFFLMPTLAPSKTSFSRLSFSSSDLVILITILGWFLYLLVPSFMQMILYLLIFEVLSTMFVQQEASHFLQWWYGQQLERALAHIVVRSHLVI